MRIFILVLFFLLSHTCFAGKLKILSRLAPLLSESSGLIVFTDSTWLTINDGNNEPIVFEINIKGKIVSQTTFLNAENFDWEELQIDKAGFIYIGDIGNNKQSRNSLTIYKFHRDDIGSEKVSTQQIHFYYPDQNHFPPKRSDRNYDSEAFLVQRDSIFIFTKDWSKPFNGISNIYFVPNSPGRYAAVFLRGFQTNSNSPYRDAVTSVCWFGSDILLLSYGAIYLINDAMQLLHTPNFVQSKRFIFKRLKQFEAIAASPDGKIYLTTEKHRLLGRAKLYLWTGTEKK